MALMVLYVDDEFMCCRYFARLCQGKVEIETFDGADLALEYLEKNGGDVQMIITDQRMPEMCGTDLLKQIQAKYPHIKRVLTTGYSKTNDIQELTDEGLIDRCLDKPWNIKEVLELLEESSAA